MRLTLGVTGHRVLAERERIVAAIDRALDRIEGRYPGRALVVRSSLAEGADRLVVERVLSRPGAALRAVLPLPLAEYLSDFESSDSRRELEDLLVRAEEVLELPGDGAREDSYEAVGRQVVDQCDVLVAIWDGQNEQGRGGTGAVVRRARELALPIAWIHAGNRRPGTLEATSLGGMQGTLTFERL